MSFIYLHGFASSSNTDKVGILRKAFPGVEIIAPDLAVNPQEVIEQLKPIMVSLARKKEKVMFVGTSLGGLYAWYFSAIYDCYAILVNPAVDPEITAKWIGPNKNFGTGKTFTWKREYIDQLNEMRKYADHNYDPKLITVVVSMDDAVVDAKNTLDHFNQKQNKSKMIQYDTEGHRFNNFDKIFPEIHRTYSNIKEQIDPTI